MTMQFHFRHLSDLMLLHTNPCLSAASQNNILKFRLVLLYHAQSSDTITLTEKDLPVFLGGLRLSTKSTVRILHPPLPCCHTGNGYVLESGCALTRAQGCRPGPAIHKNRFFDKRRPPGISRKVFTIFMQSNIYQQCAFSRLYFSLRSS